MGLFGFLKKGKEAEKQAAPEVEIRDDGVYDLKLNEAETGIFTGICDALNARLDKSHQEQKTILTRISKKLNGGMKLTEEEFVHCVMVIKTQIGDNMQAMRSVPSDLLFSLLGKVNDVVEERKKMKAEKE